MFHRCQNWTTTQPKNINNGRKTNLTIGILSSDITLVLFCCDISVTNIKYIRIFLRSLLDEYNRKGWRMNPFVFLTIFTFILTNAVQNINQLLTQPGHQESVGLQQEKSLSKDSHLHHLSNLSYGKLSMSKRNKIVLS